MDLNTQNERWYKFESEIVLDNLDFLLRLKKIYPSLSKEDIRILMFMKIKMPNKEIAKMLNILLDSLRLRRWRIKKKMGNINCPLSKFIETF